MINKYLPLAAAMLAIAVPAAAVTVVTVEAPGALVTTASGTFAVEDFDAQATGGSVTTVNTSFAAIGVAATFSPIAITPADQYLGAGGVGNGVTVGSNADLDITFTGAPLNYFGVWASALDGANTVSIYQGATLLSSTNLTQFTLSNAYLGNPSGTFAGQNGSERYAFFNFSVSEGFDRVVLTQNGGGGFELDNVTVGTTGTVPEPQTWALLVIGFGLVGATARRRKSVVAA